MATRNDTNEQNKAVDEAARTARTVTDEAARVGEQPARAGADVVRRGADVARDTFQTSLNTVSENFRRVADQFTNVLGFHGPQAEELARRSSQNVQALTEAGSVLARGAQEVSQEVFGFVQERARKNADAVNQIARVRSVQDFVAVQSDLARANLEQVFEVNKRLAETSLRIAEEAGRVIQAQAQANRRLRAA